MALIKLIHAGLLQVSFLDATAERTLPTLESAAEPDPERGLVISDPNSG